MHKRLIIFLLVFVLGCADSDESRELVLDLRSKDLKTKITATEQLRSSGTNALPTIFEMLKSGDRVEGEIALDALLIVVPHAAQSGVLTNLISLLVQTNATEPRELAAIGLGRYGISAMEALLELSRHPDPTVRWLVTEQLISLVQDHKLFREAPEIIGAITERMNDSEFKTRRLAVWAMGVLARYVEIPHEAITQILNIVGKEEAALNLSEAETLGNPRTVREYAIAVLPHIARRHPDQANRFRMVLEEVSEEQYAEGVETSLQAIAELEQ